MFIRLIRVSVVLVKVLFGQNGFARLRHALFRIDHILNFWNKIFDFTESRYISKHNNERCTLCKTLESNWLNIQKPQMLLQIGTGHWPVVSVDRSMSTDYRSMPTVVGSQESGLWWIKNSIFLCNSMIPMNILKIQ